MQLVYLAWAYEIPIDERLPKDNMLDLLKAHEVSGVFRGPPKHPKWFAYAMFSSDDIKYAKSHGGLDRWGRAVAQVNPWIGPNPPEAPKPTYAGYVEKTRKANVERSQNNPISLLRKRAKELGLNSFGKGREALAVMVAEAEGKMQKAE